MEETPHSDQPQPSGPVKTGIGLSITGFVISLVALLLWYFVNKVALMSAAFGGGYLLGASWMGISILGLVFSALGMMKARKNGKAGGLGIAGLVISIGVVALSACTIHWIHEVHEAVDKIRDEFMNAFTGLAPDSLQNTKEAAPADSSAH